MRKPVVIIALILSFCCLFVSCGRKEQKTQNELKCKIEHYQEKLDGTYELKDTESLTVSLGDEITENTYSLKTYEGFTFDSENADNVKTGTVTEDGLEIKLCYKRNVYTVTFKDGEKVIGIPQEVKYGGKAERPATDPEKTDYEFLGWYKDGEIFNFASEIKGNVEIEAKFEREWTHVYTPNN